MSEHNAYSTPQADRTLAGDQAGPELTGPHSVPAERGAAWIFEGFDYFKANPLGWIGALVVLFVISAMVSLIPLGSFAFNIVSPVFTAGLMLGCHQYREGGVFSFNHLFAGFSDNVKQLLLVGAIVLGFSLLIAVVVVAVAAFTVVDFSELISGQIPERMFSDPAGMFLPFMTILFIIVALSAPLIMALWFAPALVVLNRLSAVEAMRLSFQGCLINIVPFLFYGIVALVVLFISMIPFGLGLLITAPMMTASIYIGYRDIFTG
jgi:uncharacterized membrane protein